MKKFKLYLTGVFCLFSVTGFGQLLTDSVIDVNVREMQKQLVAKLSGQIKYNDTTQLKVRSSQHERKMTAEFLIRSLRKISLIPESHHYKLKNENFLIDLLFAPYKGTNVFSVIPSTNNSDEYVILGAHYDSEPRSPGADDNASGVALVYALAYKISLLEERKKNFMVVFFDQEEEDEIGSKAFAEKMKKENKKIHSVHIADMVGWDGNNNRAIDLVPTSDKVMPVYKKVADKMIPPVHISVSKLMSSDHKSFYDQGYDAILITEEFSNKDYSPYYHQESDRYETVNFDYLTSCTEIAYRVMGYLAKE